MDLNDKKLAYALTTLRASEHFRRFVEALEGDAQTELEELAYTTDEAEVRVGQGRYQSMALILSEIKRAPEVYEKLQRSKDIHGH